MQCVTGGLLAFFFSEVGAISSPLILVTSCAMHSRMRNKKEKADSTKFLVVGVPNAGNIVIVKGNSRQNWPAMLSQERASIESSSYVAALSDPTRPSQHFARVAVLYGTKPLRYTLVTYSGSAVYVSTQIRSISDCGLAVYV